MTRRFFSLDDADASRRAAAELEGVNAILDTANLSVSMGSNGKFYLSTFKWVDGYRHYSRKARGFDTLEALLASY